MSSSPRKRRVALFAAMLIAAGLLIGWWASRGPRQLSRPPAALDTQPTPTNSEHMGFAPVHAPGAPSAVSNVSPAEIIPGDRSVITNWEEKLDAVLREPGDEAAAARKLLVLFPRLPEAGQIEAAEHIVNLISDEDYPRLMPYLTDPSLNEEVLDEFFSDLLNQPDSVKLPAMLEIARNPKHPNAEEAREILEFYLEEDYGNDWALWGQKLAEWLKENPD